MEQTNAPGKTKAPSYRHADKQTGEKDTTSDHEDEVLSDLDVGEDDQAKKIATRQPSRPKTTGKGFSTTRDKTEEKKKAVDSDISEPLSFLLLKPAFDMGMSPIMEDSPARFIPSAWMMFEILHAMHLCTGENIYAYRANPKYNVLISRLYYAILFFVQIFRCKRLAGIATGQEKKFLSDFEDDYPFESLPIAGPLVQFFTSLTAFKHDDPRYKWITPDFVYDAADARLHKTPSPATLLSLIHQMKKPFITRGPQNREEGQRPYVSENTDTWDAFYVHPNTGAPDYDVVFGGATFDAGTPITAGHAAYLTRPGLIHPPEVTSETLKSRRPQLLRMSFPEPDAEVRKPHQFLHLEDDMGWFSNCVSVASSEAKFFLGETNLSQVSVSGTPSTLVQTAAEPLRTTPTVFHWYEGPTTMKITSKTPYGGMSVDDFAIGGFTALHHTYPANAPWNLEHLGSTRPRDAGPYHAWYNEPARLESGKAKLMNSELESVIRLKMFVAKGIENRAK